MYYYLNISVFKNHSLLFESYLNHLINDIQDSFLPHVEDGTITLLGATTENPSFQLNSALLSRCRVVVLDKLMPEDIKTILRRSLPTLGALQQGRECGDSKNILQENDDSAQR